jgi:hypothetical protein
MARSLAMRLAMRFGRARLFRIWISLARLVWDAKKTGRRRRRRHQPKSKPGGQRRLKP